MLNVRPAFMSHAHVDNEICDAIIALLKEYHLDVWYDRVDMSSGPFLAEAIERELKIRKAFIFMITKDSLTSFWVRLELGTFLGLMAHDPERIIIPVKMGPCEVPPMMSAFAWIDGTRGSKGETALAIARALDTASHYGSNAPPFLPVKIPQAPLHIVPPSARDPRLAFIPDALVQLGFTAKITPTTAELIIPPLCDIYSGSFIIGADKSRVPQAWNDETPLHEVELDAFRIARFPITVAEYDCAVRAKVVKEPQNWEEQKQKLNSPVVYVSWDDAIAYCDWLSRETSDLWRLPTEVEWEVAARWDELTRSSRFYPWGEEWNVSYANTSESNRYGVTPIDTYPKGTSPCGAMDMVGNVWEWTSSLYKDYPYDSSDGREDPYENGKRILRGGSWIDDHFTARPTYRKTVLPVDRLGTAGFRIVCNGVGEIWL